jgi:hypothetical protein
MIKRVDAAGEWVIVDSTRNPTNPANLILCANDTSKEADFGTTNRNIDLTSTGFTIQSTAAGGTTALNNSSGTYIYIAFAGGLDSIAPVNTSGTIESRVKANPTYGQSIVSYTGTGSNATVGHGLASAPELIIAKNREHSADWAVGGDDIGSWSNKTLELNNTAAIVTDSNIFGADPTTSLFTIGTSWKTNRSSYDHIAYCFHSVTGYSKIGSYTGSGSSGNAITTGFAPAFVIVKNATAIQDWQILDNTRDSHDPRTKRLEPNNADAEVDDTSYNNCIFTSTGFTWQADGGNTNASGQTYFYMAFADKREYAYWLDQSGNNNDWESNQELTESDVVLDSPSNNFCTFNPQDSENATNIPMRDGNLGFTLIANSRMRGTISSTSDSKFYIEYCSPVQIANTNVMHLGIATTNLDINTPSAFEGATGGAMVMTYFGGNDYWVAARQNGSNIGGSSINIPETKMAAGAIVSFASDSSTGKVWMAINNRWFKANGSFDATGNVLTSSNYLFQFATGHEFTPSTMPITFVGVLNCGQDSSFGGIKTPQGHQDSNEVGDFYYPPPTGFLALCTKNMEEPAVIPSEHISTTLYAGNSTDNRVISGVGFTPDLGIFKRRTGGSSPAMWFDTVRGATLQSRSDANTAESVQGNKQKTFTSDGYTLGTDAQINGTGKNHLVWNFKGGGAAVSNTNGSITSQVSANVAAGFSIATFTSITGVMTIGHGLSKAPELVTNQMTSSGSAWWTFHKDNGNTKAMRVTVSNSPGTSSNFWNNTSPSSTVVTLGAGTGGNAADAVMYCWHSVPGYSKVGIYDGNNAADGDGTFVYLGFRPSWVMIKEKDVGTGNGEWNVWDSAREPSNPNDNQVYLSTDGAESVDNIYGHLDFLSNGFKLRETYTGNFGQGAGQVGSASQTNYTTDYIYLAFAETPFKYSNAR